jgi:hypothetical protein
MENPPEYSEANLHRLPATAAPLARFAPVQGPDIPTGLAATSREDEPLAHYQPAAVVGALALFFASAGAGCLSFPQLRLVSLTLGGVSVACAVGAWVAWPKNRGATPILGGLLSLPVLLVAGFWPHLLSTTPPVSPFLDDDSFPLDSRRVVAVAIGGDVQEPPGEWIDAAKFNAQQGDLRVRILSVEVKQTKETQGPKAPPLLLHVVLRMTNVGTSRRLLYRGWAAGGQDLDRAASLHDNKGVGYRVLPSAPPAGGGLSRKTNIAPMEQLEDTLLFEPPPPKTVEYLRLELPAAAAGGAGVLRMQIPQEMIQWH